MNRNKPQVRCSDSAKPGKAVLGHGEARREAVGSEVQPADLIPWTSGDTKRASEKIQLLDIAAELLKLETEGSFSKADLRTAAKRAGKLVRIVRARAQGVRVVQACRKSGVSVATFYRWMEDFSASGLVGLTTSYEKCGRRPEMTFDEEIHFLELSGKAIMAASGERLLAALAQRVQDAPQVDACKLAPFFRDLGIGRDAIAWAVVEILLNKGASLDSLQEREDCPSVLKKAIHSNKGDLVKIIVKQACQRLRKTFGYE